MQEHPLISLKKAAAILGVDKGAIRERLSRGELAGEKRLVGSKEKWFIYAREIQSLLENRRKLQNAHAQRTLNGEVSSRAAIDTAAAGQSIPVRVSQASPLQEDFAPPDEHGADSLQDATAADSSQIWLPATEQLLSTDCAGSIEHSLPASVSSADTCMTELADAGEESPSSLDNICGSQDAVQLDYLQEFADIIERPKQLPALTDEAGESCVVESVDEPNSLSLKTMLRQLTREFAARLAEERHTIQHLQAALSEKVLLLEQTQSENPEIEYQETLREKDGQIAQLNNCVSELQLQLARFRQPWWKRLFCAIGLS